MYTQKEILDITIEMGEKKIKKPLLAKGILGFIGGAMIALGYLSYIRVSSSIPASLGSLRAFLGASVFPIGLIIILIAGGELVTGNMMAVSAAFFDKKVTLFELFKNWLVITIANSIGALSVAYFFGHVTGLTSASPYVEHVVSIATHKVDMPFLAMFLSGIGCNWFVGLAVWLCYGAKGMTGKIIGIWFPVMIFVAIGFQHSIANAFIIPAAIFEGSLVWKDFIQNFVVVYLGNIIGGSVFVSGFYYLSYRH